MLKKSLLAMISVLLLTLLSGAAFAQEPPTPVPPGQTLSAILARGQVVCGVNEEVFGFGFLNPNTGNITGLYVDFCRALATAVFGDPAAVELRLQTSGSPPDLLVSGELDVLMVRDNVQTLSSDSSGGLQFGPPLFNDGQSFMMPVESGIAAWEDLDEQTLCTLRGQPEANLIAALSQRDLIYDLLTFDSVQTMQEAFFTGRCNVQSLDRSLLEIRRQSTGDPDRYLVWETPFTRSAVGPLYRYGDQQWANIVNWTVWGLMHAEALGVSSETVDTLLRREGETDVVYLARVGQPVASMLDAALGLGQRLGLANDFMVPIIRQIGNYGEMYQRSLGPQSALPIARGLNALWTEGGVLYAPPWQ